MSLGYEGGDGGEKVEDNHGKRVPVAEKYIVTLIESIYIKRFVR